MNSTLTAYWLLCLIAVLTISAQTGEPKIIRAKRQCCTKMASCCRLLHQQQQSVPMVPMMMSQPLQSVSVVQQEKPCGCDSLMIQEMCKCPQPCISPCTPDCSRNCLEQQQTISSSQYQQEQSRECIGFCLPLCDPRCVELFELSQVQSYLQAVLPQLLFQPSGLMQPDLFLPRTYPQSTVKILPDVQPSLSFSLKPCLSDCDSICPPHCSIQSCCQMCPNLPFCRQSVFLQNQPTASLQAQRLKCVEVCMPACDFKCVQQACPPACHPKCELQCVQKVQAQIIVLAQQQSQLPQRLRPPPQPQLPQRQLYQTQCTKECMPQCLQECVRRTCDITCQPDCLPECTKQQKKTSPVVHQQKQPQQCAPQCRPECQPRCIQYACTLACQPTCSPECTKQQKPLVVTVEALQKEISTRKMCLFSCMPDCLPSCLKQQQQVHSGHISYCPQICQPTCSWQCLKQQQLCSKTCFPSCQSFCKKNPRCVQECIASCELSCMDFNQQLSQAILATQQYSPTEKMRRCGLSCKTVEPFRCIPQCQPSCMQSCIEQQTSGHYQQLQPSRDCMQQHPQECSCTIGYTPCAQKICCLRRRHKFS
uniref:Cysteine rich repeat-containing domain protein n=1 Tax=Setaria digitata TaxID=48799 RepID=A0A915PN56_9BILA